MAEKLHSAEEIFVILKEIACNYGMVVVIILHEAEGGRYVCRIYGFSNLLTFIIMENEENTQNAATSPTPSSDTQDRLKAARDYACAQYDKLRRATAEQLETVRKYTTEQIGNVRKYTDEAREQINAGWDVTRAKAKDLHEAGEQYVKANPTGTVLGALGVGIIIGLLLGSGRR